MHVLSKMHLNRLSRSKMLVYFEIGTKEQKLSVMDTIIISIAFAILKYVPVLSIFFSGL